MPLGHNVVGVLCEPRPDTAPINTWEKPLSVYPTPDRVFLQYYAVDKVNRLRMAYEEIHGEYDLVIRTRPDLTI
jgi:hypothetical protein